MRKRLKPGLGTGRARIINGLRASGNGKIEAKVRLFGGKKTLSTQFLECQMYGKRSKIAELPIQILKINHQISNVIRADFSVPSQFRFHTTIAITRTKQSILCSFDGLRTSWRSQLQIASLRFFSRNSLSMK